MKKLLNNLISNIPLAISTTAFVLLRLVFYSTKIGIMLPCTLLAIIIIFSVFPKEKLITKTKNMSLKYLSLLSTMGIIYFNVTQVNNRIIWDVFDELNKLLIRLNVSNSSHILYFVYALLSVLSIYAVYHFVLKIFNYTYGVLKELIHEMKKYEKITYIILAVILCTYVAFSYAKSYAFYGAGNYDAIYTTDSYEIYSDNAYMTIINVENDIRQPLFAYFSMPFASFAYILSIPFENVSSVASPVILQSLQIIIYILANFIVAKNLKLKSTDRICYMILSFVCYSGLLFTLVMEQYIFSYFYLMLLIDAIMQKKESLLCLYGASGSIVTSYVLSLFGNHENVFKKLLSCIKYGILFIITIFALGKGNIFFCIRERYTQLMSFTTGNPLVERINQFISYCATCFISPKHVIEISSFGLISIQQSVEAITKINILGLVIIALFIIGFILNRKDKFTQIMAFWGLFSFIMLCVIGYGTVENGLILYSLYFGWVILAMIFKLLDKVKTLTNIKYLIPIFSVCAGILLIVFNIGPIVELFKFCIAYYPVI